MPRANAPLTKCSPKGTLIKGIKGIALVSLETLVSSPCIQSQNVNVSSEVLKMEEFKYSSVPQPWSQRGVSSVLGDKAKSPWTRIGKHCST